MSSGNSDGSAGGPYRYEPPPPPPPPAPPHHRPLPGNRSLNTNNTRNNPGSEQSPTTPSHRRLPSVFDRLQRGRVSQPSSPPISPLTQAPGAEQTSTRGSRSGGHTASTHDQPNAHAYPRRSSHGAHGPVNVGQELPARASRPRAGTFHGHKHQPPFQPASQYNSQPTNMAPTPNPLHPLDEFWLDASRRRANSTSRATARRKNSYPPPPSVEDAAESEESDLESRTSSQQVPSNPPKQEKPPPPRRQPSSGRPPGADKPVGPGEKYSAGAEVLEKNETPPPEIHVRVPRPYGSQARPRPNAENEWTFPAPPPLVRSDTEVSLPPQIPTREPRPYGSQSASQFVPGGLPPGSLPKLQRTDTDISLPPEIPAREPRPYGSQSSAQPTDRDNEWDFVPGRLGRTDTDTSLPPQIPSRQPRPYGLQPQNAATGNTPHLATHLKRTDTDTSLPPELPGREPQPYSSIKRTDTDTSLPPELPGREPQPYSKIERSDTDTSLPAELPSRQPRPYFTQGPGSACEGEELSTSDRPGSPLGIPTREPRPYSSQGSRTSEKTHGTQRSSTVPPETPRSTNRDLSPQELARLPPCPKYNFTHWGTWFQLPFVSGFDICAHCYYTHIHESQFGHYFSQAEKEHDVEKSCDFHTPRMQELWAVAIRTQSFEPVANYMERRVRIPDCKGHEAGVCDNWWGVPSEIPDFAVCEACYNDIVLASPLASRFVPLDPRPEDIETMCDLAVPGLKKRFLRLIDPESPTHGNTWKDFVRSATYRITEVPKCVGTSYVGGPRNWWTTKKPISGFVICEACYLDEIELSPWREKFIPTPAKQPRSVKWSCDFTMVGVALAWEVSLSNNVKNFDHFWYCADATIKLHPCESEVLDGAQWYKISGIDNFTVCPTCFFTVIVAADFGRHFYVEPYPLGARDSCDMGPESPRHKRLLAKLAESLDLGDFSKFKEFAYTRSLFPPCPEDTGVTGRKWYGTDSFIVCEECYVDVVKPSSLASALTLHGALIEDSASCDIYSPRMKRIWAEACQLNDVGHFAASAKHRAEVYFRVKPAMNQVRALLQMQRNVGGMYPPAPAAAGSSAGHKHVVTGFNGYSYGNLVVGYGFESPQEVEAATMRKRANSTGVGDPALWQELFMLEQEWKAVE